MGSVHPPRAVPQDPDAIMETLAFFRSCHRGQEIYGRNDLARYWARVASGLARACVLHADGRRQIIDFLQPGDFFGLAVPDSAHITLEAVVEGTVVALYPRERLEALADADPRLSRYLREVAFESIARLQRRMLMLGPMTAAEKVGSFFVELANRSSQSKAATLVLRMSRYDIADYLGLSAETVSRAVTNLKHQGAILLAGTHSVKIVDRGALDIRVDGEVL
jgi:CRP-like cAMP-binding protein